MTAGRALDHLATELAALADRGLLRDAGAAEDAALIDLCSNDYLGFAREPWPRSDTALGAASGAGASRLVSGSQRAHLGAEAAAAAWVGLEASLLFTSGYAANVGVLSALAQRGDLIVSDAANHASIIDGCRLSGAEVAVTRHLDLEDMRSRLRASGARRRCVVTEAYFSMDADSPDLRALREMCDEHHAALIVDEAHSLGVFGPGGAGLCAEVGVQPDVLVGTLGKAVGLQGAFVAGSAPLRAWLWNRARSFVFSTGVSPMLASAVAARIGSVMNADGRRARLREASTAVRASLAQTSAAVRGRPDGPICPWIVGGVREAATAADRLRAAGIHVAAIRPPTVPAGSARLRITASAALSPERLSAVLAALPAAVTTAGTCFT